MTKEKVLVSKITDREEKADIVKDVLADLPEWFGLPESTAHYIEDAKKAELWSVEYEGESIGFITLTETTADTAEIHCMGIKKAWHRKGIGAELLMALEGFAKEHYSYLQVKTVDQGHYKEYDQTIA
ncbi:MAG: GNAT family N-acetyltransferase, partial [Alkalibacterium sp.]|nr:GNAT family N-acetyltransferase [Alkalibacterium sp.]